MARKRKRAGDDDRQRSVQPSRQPGDPISDRNNNTTNAARDQPAGAPNVERASDAGIGDAAVNDQKMTRYRANRSTDA